MFFDSQCITGLCGCFLTRSVLQVCVGVFLTHSVFQVCVGVFFTHNVLQVCVGVFLLTVYYSADARSCHQANHVTALKGHEMTGALNNKVLPINECKNNLNNIKKEDKIESYIGESKCYCNAF